MVVELYVVNILLLVPPSAVNNHADQVCVNPTDVDALAVAAVAVELVAIA